MTDGGQELARRYNRIRAVALKKLESELDPMLHYHNVLHTRDDVLPATIRLAEMEGITVENKYSLRIAALFHDMGFIQRYDDNEILAVRMLERMLPEFGVMPSQIRQISDFVMATRMPQNPGSLEERIICDADLFSLGRDGFFSRSYRLKREISHFLHPIGEKEWLEGQVAFLEEHAYFTNSAKSLRDAGKERNISLLREMVSTL